MEFTRTKLSVEVVEKVENYLNDGYSYSKINSLTGVSKSTISKIKNGTYVKGVQEFKIENEEKYKKLAKAYKQYKKAYEEQKKELDQLKILYEQLKERANSMNEELKVSKVNLSRIDFFK